MDQPSKPGSPSPLSWLILAMGLWLLGLGIRTVAAGQSSLWNFVRIVGGLYLISVEVRQWLARRSAAKRQVAAATAAENDGPIRSLVFLPDGPRDIQPGAWIEHSVNDDNEQMEAAVAEARSRWPEFVALFQKRDPASDRPFIIKAPFTDREGTEFMWVSVTALDGDTIHGTLANQPHRSVDYHEGQPVAVAAVDINDWLCADDNDQPLGGWTQKVLMARSPSKSAD